MKATSGGHFSTASWCWNRSPIPALAGIGSSPRIVARAIAVRPLRGSELAALNLVAGPGGQQHKRLGIACLRRLSGAGMGALGAIVLRHRIDAVAFLQLVFLHARHVVLHDLRRIGHALRADRRGLHGKRKPDGGCQSGSRKQLMSHDSLSFLSRYETDSRKFARRRRKVTGYEKNSFLSSRVVVGVIDCDRPKQTCAGFILMSVGRHSPASLSIVSAST